VVFPILQFSMVSGSFSGKTAKAAQNDSALSSLSHYGPDEINNQRKISAASYSPTPSEGSTIGAEGLCWLCSNGAGLSGEAD